MCEYCGYDCGDKRVLLNGLLSCSACRVAAMWGGPSRVTGFKRRAPIPLTNMVEVVTPDDVILSIINGEALAA